MRFEPAPVAVVAAAWEVVRSLVGAALTLFGPPSELLQMRAVPRGFRRDLLVWLRGAEGLVRQLLLLRAAEIAQGPPPRPALPRKPRAARRREPQRRVAPENSAAWRGVRFATLPPARTQVARHRPGLGVVAVSGWGLAKRLEALIRAVHAPEPLAVRLARRLRAAPGLTRRLDCPDAEDRPQPSWEAVRYGRARLIVHNPARASLRELAPYTEGARAFFNSG